MTEATAQPPRVNRSVDIKTLPLRPEEAFVFSRVDGHAQPREIALTTGMSTDQVEQALDRLSELGALEGWRVRKAPAQSPGPPPTAPAKPPTPNPPKTDRHATPQTSADDDGFVPVPDLDISAQEQQRVWRLWKRLAHSNHYELLGLPRDASREQVKSAYFEQVSAFHPDKHFGKTLGTYKDKLEAVFQRLTQAHDTLSRTRRREQYDATLPPAPSHESDGPGPIALEPKLDGSEKPQRTAEPAAVADVNPPASTSGSPPASAASRRSAAPSSRTAAAPNDPPSAPAPDARVPPVAAEQRRQMAIRSLERGMRSITGGERQPPQPSAPSRRSPSGAPPPSSRSLLLDRARAAQRDGDLEGAATCYEKAAASRKDASLFARAAQCFEQAANTGENPATLWKRAADSARQAVSLAPNNAELRLILSRVYAGAGMRASATREAEKARELSPSEKSVQSWLERLRRGDV